MMILNYYDSEYCFCDINKIVMKNICMTILKVEKIVGLSSLVQCLFCSRMA